MLFRALKSFEYQGPNGRRQKAQEGQQVEIKLRSEEIRLIADGAITPELDANATLPPISTKNLIPEEVIKREAPVSLPVEPVAIAPTPPGNRKRTK